MVHFSEISCWYALAGLLLGIFPFQSIRILNELCIYNIIITKKNSSTIIQGLRADFSYIA
jgi:hypothetical protein